MPARDSCENSNVSFHPPKEQLPNWFTPSSLVKDGFYIGLGISDPFQDDSIACKQALNRAISLIVLQYKSHFEALTDNYINAIEKKSPSRKIVTFYKLYASHKIDTGQIIILKKHISTYGEVFILAGIPKACMENEKGIMVNIEAEFLLFEQGKKSLIRNSYFKNLSKGLLNQNEAITYTSYNSKHNREIHSLIGDNELAFPAGIYHYYTIYEKSDKAKINNYITSKLLFSFWNGWIEAIFQCLDIKSKNISKIKILGDMYGENQKYLSREISKITFSFSVTDFFIQNNILHLQLQINQNINSLQ